MTDKQPEALRLANELGGYVYDDRREWSDSEYVDNLPNNYIRDAAAELRRLHEVNAELLAALDKLARLGNGDRYGNSIGNTIAQEAIAKATGEQQ
jgi:hypothetical protein